MHCGPLCHSAHCTQHSSGFWQPIHCDVSSKTFISPLAIYLSFPAVTRAHAQSAERRVWNNDVRHRPRSGGKIMWEKTNLLAPHSSHSEAEYQTKKKNMRPEGNTVFSYILNTSSKWKGAGEGRENTQEREAVRMWGRTLKEMRRWKRLLEKFPGQSGCSLVPTVDTSNDGRHISAASQCLRVKPGYECCHFVLASRSQRLHSRAALLSSCPNSRPAEISCQLWLLIRHASVWWEQHKYYFLGPVQTA